MGQALGRRLVEREADALVAALVDEHEAAGVLLPDRLRADRVARPDRAAARRRVPSTKSIRPVMRCSARKRRALSGVSRGGSTAIASAGTSSPRSLSAPLIGLGLERAGVLAVRVEEGDDHRPAAQVGHPDALAVLVAAARTPERRQVRSAGGRPRTPRRAPGRPHPRSRPPRPARPGRRPPPGRARSAGARSPGRG